VIEQQEGTIEKLKQRLYEIE